MDTFRAAILTAIVIGTIGSQISFDADNANAEANNTAAIEIPSAAAEIAAIPAPALEQLVFENATPAQVELAEEAIQSFEDAGLELPRWSSSSPPRLTGARATPDCSFPPPPTTPPTASSCVTGCRCS